MSYFTLRIIIILIETIKDLYIRAQLSGLTPTLQATRWPAGSDLGEWWLSRLVATAAEDRLSFRPQQARA